MRRTTFLEQTLGTDRPWYVENAELDPGSGVFAVHLNFEKGGTFTCGACGRRNCKAYDTTAKRWRHMDFFEYRTFLHAPSPRVTCPTCGIRQARIPWARPRRGFTRDLEDFVTAMAEDFPVTTVARILGENDTRLGYMLRRNSAEQTAGSSCAFRPPQRHDPFSTRPPRHPG